MNISIHPTDIGKSNNKSIEHLGEERITKHTQSHTLEHTHITFKLSLDRSYDLNLSKLQVRLNIRYM